jgi:F-type H+-transporting ATPase subunit delta
VAEERVDPGARVYARALYEAAGEVGRVAQVDRDLHSLMEALAGNPVVLRALVNPELPREAKRRILAKLMEDADPLARNALLVMVDNGRLPLLYDMQLGYAELAAREERILTVEVTTAVPLEQRQLDGLAKRISEAVGQDARVTATVDESILGGLVLRARGVLLDASVRHRLDELRRTLVNTPLPVGSEA